MVLGLGVEERTRDQGFDTYCHLSGLPSMGHREGKEKRGFA